MSWSSKGAFLPSVIANGEKQKFGFFDSYCFWLTDEELLKRLSRSKKEHKPVLDLFRFHSQGILYPQRHSWALLGSAHHGPAFSAWWAPDILPMQQACVHLYWWCWVLLHIYHLRVKQRLRCHRISSLPERLKHKLCQLKMQLLNFGRTFSAPHGKAASFQGLTFSGVSSHPCKTSGCSSQAAKGRGSSWGGWAESLAAVSAATSLLRLTSRWQTACAQWNPSTGCSSKWQRGTDIAWGSTPNWMQLVGCRRKNKMLQVE